MTRPHLRPDDLHSFTSEHVLHCEVCATREAIVQYLWDQRFKFQGWTFRWEINERWSELTVNQLHRDLEWLINQGLIERTRKRAWPRGQYQEHGEPPIIVAYRIPRGE